MEAYTLRKVISKLRNMLEDKAKDLMKVVGENFTESYTCWGNDINTTLVQVEAIAERLMQMSLDKIQFVEVPAGSEDVQQGDVDADAWPDIVLSDEGSPDCCGDSDWSVEIDRSWHFR